MGVSSARVPDFASRAPAGRLKTENLLAHNGALLLCQTIEKAWAKAGHPEIRAEPVLVQGDPKGRGSCPAHYTIRIDGLLNGMPVARP
jgi:hypothetical protein